MKQIFIFCLFILSLNQLVAQPGELDYSFDPGAGFSGATSKVMLLPDGRILAAGSFYHSSVLNTDKLIRFFPDGSLDLSLNDPITSNIQTFGLQSDGKIIVAHYQNIDRLNANGSYDNTFNSGQAFLASPSRDVYDIVVQPDGKILVSGNFSWYDGTYINNVMRLNADGSIDGTFNIGTGPNDAIYELELQSDGKILLYGKFTAFNGSAVEPLIRLNSDGSLDGGFDAGITIPYPNYTDCVELDHDQKIFFGGNFQISGSLFGTVRLNTDGTIDNFFTPGTGRMGSIARQADGKYILGGNGFSWYNGVAAWNLIRLEADGTPDPTFDPGKGLVESNGSINSIIIQADGRMIMTGDYTLYTDIPRQGIIRVHGDKGVFGSFFNDINQNAAKDNMEPFLPGRRATIQPGNITVQSDLSGHFWLDELPAGNYTITPDTNYNGDWLLTTPYVSSFTVSGGLTYIPSVGFVSTNPCSDADLSIAMPIVRRCFTGQSVYVTATNSFFATGILQSAYAIVKLDSLLIFQTANVPFTDLGNNTYRLEMGDIYPGGKKSAILTVQVSCSVVAGQTLCSEGQIFPLDPCAVDSVAKPYPPGVTPCTLPWDKSSLKVEGWCANDSIYFAVINHGSGDMACYSPVRVYVDGVQISLDSIMLNSGDTALFVFAGTGETWRIEADQHPLHPGHSRPNANVELCGSGNWTPGIIGSLPTDDFEAAKDIFCAQVTAPHDPNDKRGFPSGLGTTADIMPNQDIEYMVRFQNTGTDTAFTVVIRDTIQPEFDIYSLRSGVASHDYTFSIESPRVAVWRFANIFLTDSTTNEPESHGFITFTIKQTADLPNGTELKNTADIYFDFEAPVITNTSLHTVNSCIQNKTFKNMNADFCGTYTAPDGQVYTAPGAYKAIIPNALGCDSIISINLNEQQINAGILNDNGSLTASGFASDVQWVDCNQTFAPIGGQNSFTYNPDFNGSYAAILSQGSCIDTTDCIAVTNLSLTNVDAKTNIRIQPNPSAGLFFVNLGDTKAAEIRITDLSGRMIAQQSVIGKSEFTVSLVNEGTGVYLLQLIRDGEAKEVFKLMKE